MELIIYAEVKLIIDENKMSKDGLKDIVNRLRDGTRDVVNICNAEMRVGTIDVNVVNEDGHTIYGLGDNINTVIDQLIHDECDGKT